jgi:hypothetical protein
VTDEQLAGDVSDELHWDPKLDNSAIAVSSVDGRVTLRGTDDGRDRHAERHGPLLERAGVRCRGCLGRSRRPERGQPAGDRRLTPVRISDVRAGAAARADAPVAAVPGRPVRRRWPAVAGGPAVRRAGW